MSDLLFWSVMAVLIAYVILLRSSLAHAHDQIYQLQRLLDPSGDPQD